MKLIILFVLVVLSTQTKLLSQSKLQTQCHPQCSWKCDDPHCPAICDPVCEPPKCHTSCAEPKNAICDVKCEKPECEIKCPDKGYEALDCPKCVTVCKQPHCVTHCQAPKPECEPVCEEPKCDWKCHKPQCPKPKCELVCENPNCTPKVECCDCMTGMPKVATPFPFFKETEHNKECCACNNQMKGSFMEMEQEVNNTRMGVSVQDYGTHVVKTDLKSTTQLLEHPVPIGDSFYEHPTEIVNKFEQGPKYTVSNSTK